MHLDWRPAWCLDWGRALTVVTADWWMTWSVELRPENDMKCCTKTEEWRGVVPIDWRRTWGAVPRDRTTWSTVTGLFFSCLTHGASRISWWGLVVVPSPLWRRQVLQWFYSGEQHEVMCLDWKMPRVVSLLRWQCKGAWCILQCVLPYNTISECLWFPIHCHGCDAKPHILRHLVFTTISKIHRGDWSGSYECFYVHGAKTLSNYTKLIKLPMETLTTSTKASRNVGVWALKCLRVWAHELPSYIAI